MDREFDFNPAKRAQVLLRRGIDLVAVAAVFVDERRLDFVDERRAYGEIRRITIGKAGH
jgi:uncharacterized DUF497 family protein